MKRHDLHMLSVVLQILMNVSFTVFELNLKCHKNSFLVNIIYFINYMNYYRTFYHCYVFPTIDILYSPVNSVQTFRFRQERLKNAHTV